jgi:hypothetical protein
LLAAASTTSSILSSTVSANSSPFLTALSIFVLAVPSTASSIFVKVAEAIFSLAFITMSLAPSP